MIAYFISYSEFGFGFSNAAGRCQMIREQPIRSIDDIAGIEAGIRSLRGPDVDKVVVDGWQRFEDQD